RRDPALLERPDERPDHRLLPGPGKKVVILDVGAEGNEVVPVLLARRVVRLFEEVELELRASSGQQAHLRRAIDLACQNPTRRDLDWLARVPDGIVQDQRGLRQPGRPAKRRPGRTG